MNEFVAFALFPIFSQAVLFIRFHDSVNGFSKYGFEYVFNKPLDEFVCIRWIISSLKPVVVLISTSLQGTLEAQRLATGYKFNGRWRI